MQPDDTQTTGVHAFEGQTMRWRLTDGVLEVELCRAPCNEIGIDFLEEAEALIHTLNWIAHRVRAVVFHSTQPKGFSAGADLLHLHAALEESPAHRDTLDGLSIHDLDDAEPTLSVAAELKDFVERIHRVLRTLDMLPIPTIAAVHGFCFGGGFELALACDIIVADKSARFCFPELRLGLIPGFGGLPRLRRNVGTSTVMDLLLSGRSISAARAHELGIIGQLVGRGEAHRAAMALAREASGFERAAVHGLKHFVKDPLDEQLAMERTLFLRLLASPAVRAALDDFAQRQDDPFSYQQAAPRGAAVP